MYIVWGGDCPECGLSPLYGFEAYATWQAISFTCDFCDADVTIDAGGDWGD